MMYNVIQFIVILFSITFGNTIDCKAGVSMVHCGRENISSENTTTPLLTIKSAIQNTSAKKNKTSLLAPLSYCGFQHTDDRIYNRTVTALDEFPWLVHIRFSFMEYDTQFADRCAGILINDRYVLTDAYCGTEALRVKLGEYNTNKTVSCDTSSGLIDCTESSLDVAVEEIIRESNQKGGPYGFALLRLAKAIKFSDFIRPICLPLDESTRPMLNYVTYSGWGALNATGISKKRLVYDVAEDDVCYKIERLLENQIEVANHSFICTIPRKSNTEFACNGEHGGAFMYKVSRRHQWFAEGIIIRVMSDTNICTNTQPVNGVRITPKVIKWIISNLRP